MTTHKTLKLQSRFTKHLLSQPETGMGYQKVSVTLKNGTQLCDRTVTNAQYLLLENTEHFTAKDIKAISLAQ